MKKTPVAREIHLEFSVQTNWSHSKLALPPPPPVLCLNHNKISLMSSATHSRILQEMHCEEYILLWVESIFQLNALELISEDLESKKFSWRYAPILFCVYRCKFSLKHENNLDVSVPVLYHRDFQMYWSGYSHRSLPCGLSLQSSRDWTVNLFTHM